MFETKEVALLYAPSDSLNKVGFVEMCEMWRKRVTNENVLADVFDGNIWKEWTVSTVPNGQEAKCAHIAVSSPRPEVFSDIAVHHRLVHR